MDDAARERLRSRTGTQRPHWLRRREYVYISSPQTGWITSTSFQLGDSVSLADTLFELDKDLEQLMYEEARGRSVQMRAQTQNLSTGARPEEIAALEAKLEEAEAQRAFAQSEYDRKYPLVQKEILAEAEGDALTSTLNRSRAAVRAAEEAIAVARLGGRDAARQAAVASEISSSAALMQTEWKLDQRTIQATVAGVVEMVFHRQGEFVTVGSPVLAILPPQNIKIRFFVPEERVTEFSIGKTVRVMADGLATPIDASVSFIAKESEFTPPVIYSTEARQKLVFMVEARLPVGTVLRPGLPVDITLQ